MPLPKLWTHHPDYVEKMLRRSSAAVRSVTDAVEERWQQANAGSIPPGRDTAELAASAGLPAFTVKHVSLLIQLHKEIITMVNKSVVLGPLSAWDRWRVRRELRKAVKTVEQGGSDILESLGRPSR